MVEINKKILLLLLSIFLCISLVSAENSVIDTLEQGETKFYTLNGKSYEVTITYIGTIEGASRAKFQVNDETTPPIANGETYELTDGAKITVKQIFEEEAGEVTADAVEFEIVTLYCGDNICSANENCALCPADCGCSSNYECKNMVCVRKVICGDDICECNEDCEKDNCCDGKNINFDTNEDHCGECYNQCTRHEKCKNGDCITYCGNKVCDGRETCATCPKDCGCEKGYECVIGDCRKIEVDECSVNSDCNDGKACTTDICSGSPKKCSYTIKTGCESKGGCVAEGTVGLKNSKQVYCDGNDWTSQRELNENCESGYECKINSCINGTCKEKEDTTQKDYIQTNIQTNIKHENVISRFFDWFKSIWG